ncbi:hypothetical protein L3556_10955 [Candidatus Synechococcus calcipolaris G9]|uniref:Glycine zipper domain-containing protein n=1 Tax=Candidatus Synechococcus calcipolaris G9 TaxID=1497997 RepID=A0ABT6F0Q9_9SYNE|nr:hypothetical protein [Candidatus Synechococcus calcipolaris]MDG2991444.1 hypothetical protein [Candidatus Synechococcus calcipolaris G9]
MPKPSDDEESLPPVAELVHLTRDRLRLRLPLLKKDPDYGRYLQDYLKPIPGITEVRLNLQAASLSIHYALDLITPLQILALIERWGDVQIIGQGHKGLENLTRAFELEPQEVGGKLKQMGGFVVGGQIGDVVGGVVGGTAGGVFMGPAGMLMGAQVGTFVGGVIGGRLGIEAMEQISQLTFQDMQDAPGPKTALTPEEIRREAEIAKALEIRSGAKMGEVVGELAGGIAGQTVLGPPGEAVGRVLGEMLGGQIGEDVSRQVAEKSEAAIPTDLSVNIVLEWWMKTSRAFVGETALATLGGLLSRVILGPQAESVGLRAGTRVGRLVDWNGQDGQKTKEMAETPPTETEITTSPESNREGKSV